MIKKKITILFILFFAFLFLGCDDEVVEDDTSVKRPTGTIEILSLDPENGPYTEGADITVTVRYTLSGEGQAELKIGYGNRTDSKTICIIKNKVLLTSPKDNVEQSSVIQNVPLEFTIGEETYQTNIIKVSLNPYPIASGEPYTPIDSDEVEIEVVQAD